MDILTSHNNHDNIRVLDSASQVSVRLRTKERRASHVQADLELDFVAVRQETGGDRQQVDRFAAGTALAIGLGLCKRGGVDTQQLFLIYKVPTLPPVFFKIYVSRKNALVRKGI